MDTKENSTPEKVFSEGLLNLLQPLFKEYDSRMKNIQLSQTEVADRVTKLNESLRKCQKQTEYVDVKPYLTRLGNCKKDIHFVSSTMLKISDRLNKLIKLAKIKYPELFMQYNYHKQKKDLQKKNEVIKSSEKENPQKGDIIEKKEDVKNEDGEESKDIIDDKEKDEKKVEKIKEEEEEEVKDSLNESNEENNNMNLDVVNI